MFWVLLKERLRRNRSLDRAKVDRQRNRSALALARPLADRAEVSATWRIKTEGIEGRPILRRERGRRAEKSDEKLKFMRALALIIINHGVKEKNEHDRQVRVNATRRNYVSGPTMIGVINRVIRLRHVRLTIILSYYGKFNSSNRKVKSATQVLRKERERERER